MNQKYHHRPYFVNPITGGADPCTCLDTNGDYYYVSGGGDGIYLFRSRTLSDFGVPSCVYKFPLKPNGAPILQSVWAPEIHEIRGEYYIYFTASEEPASIENWPKRRMYALHAASAGGPYGELTQLSLDENMSIDGTVLQMPNGDLYMVYMRNASPCKPQEDDPTAHHNKLYIAKMRDPMHIQSSPTQLTAPEYPWESDICEGPFPLVHAGKVFLIYAANAAHLPEYCLGLLTCVDPANPLDAKSWVKSPEPIFTAAGNVYGAGHASVVPSPDHTELWLLYHSKCDKSATLPAGWNRWINAKKIEWNDDGTPNLGIPAQYGEKIPLPSGESDVWEEGGTLADSAFALNDMLQRYAHTFAPASEEGIMIRHTLYPTKLLFRRCEWTDAEIVGEMISDAAELETGLIARASYVSAGPNRLYGYMALFKAGTATLWRCDGEVRTELAKVPCVLPNCSFCASLRAEGESLTLSLNGKELLNAADSTYTHGRMGFYCDADTLLQSIEIRK